MKFYHNFYTDLPDQYVEANADRLIKWAHGWKDKNRYYHRSAIIDMVPVDFVGNAKKDAWPTFKAASLVMVSDWMKKKGDQHSGRYWESLTEDQRSPARIASDPGRGQGTAYYTYAPAGPILSAPNYPVDTTSR